MQIQRIQSIYLLLAAIVTGIFIFIPFGTLTLDVDDSTLKAVAELKPFDFIGLLLPAGLSALLLLVDIFLFNNLKLQKTVLTFATLLNLVSIIVVIYILTDSASQGTIAWGGGGLLLVAALIGAIAAMNRIKHDERLLRSSSRLF